MSEQAMAQKGAQPVQAQPTTASPTHGILQRCSSGIECEECRARREEREGKLQRAAVNIAPTATPSVPPIVHDVLNSPGHSLDANTRSFMESRFRHDFSNVRVHTDAKATESARAVNALAYTVGRDVVFGSGQYMPGTMTGKRLLAHELTHVVQQGVQSPQSLKSLRIDSGRRDPQEKEAESVAQRVIVNSSPKNVATQPAGAAPALLQRKVTATTDESIPDASVATDDDKKPVSPGIRTGGLTANSLIQTHDANIRLGVYTKPAKEQAEKIFQDWQSGKLTHQDARVQAVAGRNKLLTEAREQMSPGGKSFSKAIKEEGKTVEELIPKYVRKLLSERPELLKKYGLKTVDPKSPLFDAAKFEVAVKDLSETAEVSAQIIKAAGRTSKVVTGVAKFTKVAGPIGMAVGVSISAYEVATAPEGQKLHVAGREGSGFAGGLIGASAGGVAAGWVASLACGPGAPLCALVITITIVGAASYAGGAAGEGIFEAATSDEKAQETEHPSASLNQEAQLECVGRLGGCLQERAGGVPTAEEIAGYNTQCRKENNYAGPDVTPSDDDCKKHSGH